MMGREEFGEGKELLMVQCIPPHLMGLAYMAANGTGALVIKFNQMLHNPLEGTHTQEQ